MISDWRPGPLPRQDLAGSPGGSPEQARRPGRHLLRIRRRDSRPDPCSLAVHRPRRGGDRPGRCPAVARRLDSHRRHHRFDDRRLAGHPQERLLGRSLSAWRRRRILGGSYRDLLEGPPGPPGGHFWSPRCPPSDPSPYRPAGCRLSGQEARFRPASACREGNARSMRKPRYQIDEKTGPAPRPERRRAARSMRTCATSANSVVLPEAGS